MKRLILLAFSLLGFLGQAEDKMNGYSLKQFGDFEKSWHLVTVRFRKDTDEMRFTYANDPAWKTLSDGRIDFPDGAVFAKVGVMTKPDPAFVSSVVPSGARRVQIMVKDKRAHVEDDGWGYALFDREGKVFPDHGRNAVKACVACHHIVPDRGFVFSQIMGREVSSGNGWAKRISFKDQALSALPNFIKQKLPKDIKKVRLVEGDLAKAPFFGTLDEMQPILAAETVRSGLPSVLLSANKKDFSLVKFAENQVGCNDGKKEKALTGIHTLPVREAALYENSFCF